MINTTMEKSTMDGKQQHKPSCVRRVIKILCVIITLLAVVLICFVVGGNDLPWIQRPTWINGSTFPSATTNMTPIASVTIRPTKEVYDPELEYKSHQISEFNHIRSSADLLHLDVPEYLPGFRSRCWLVDTDENEQTTTAATTATIATSTATIASIGTTPSVVHGRKSKLGTGRSNRGGRSSKSSVESSSDSGSSGSSGGGGSGRHRERRSTGSRDDSSHIQCLPLVFVAGFPKCGTTDLYEKLLLHPQILVGGNKEPHFWSGKRNMSFHKYLDKYRNASLEIAKCSPSDTNCYHERVTIDGSASTFWHFRASFQYPVNKNLAVPRTVPADILHTFIPDARFIVIMRDPVERYYSSYLYFSGKKKILERGLEGFHDHVSGAIEEFDECVESFSEERCCFDYTPSTKYLVLGIYYIYIRQWRSRFPDESFFFTRLDDYSKDRAGVLSQIASFLDLEPFDFSRIEERVSNKSGGIHEKMGDMLGKTRKLLERFFRPYNQKLAETLDDKDFTWHYS